MVATTSPSTVGTARGVVATRHVEPVLTTLAVGLVHIPIHIMAGETTVRTAGRDSTSETSTVGLATLKHRGAHSNDPTCSTGRNVNINSMPGLPYTDTVLTTTAVPPIMSSAPGIKTGVCADGVTIASKTVTAPPAATAGPPHAKVLNPILPTLLS